MGRDYGPTFWNKLYNSEGQFFGAEPSVLARRSLPLLERKGCQRIMELGCGYGRDTLFFAREGLKVFAVDCSSTAVHQLEAEAGRLGLSQNIETKVLDMRSKLPEVPSFDAVYSHLFFAMPFNNSELARLFSYVRDSLKKGGLHIFSVRSIQDRFYGKGKMVRARTFEVNGFQIRFFDSDEVEKLNRPLRLLKMQRAREEPCSLLLFYSVKNRGRTL